MEQLELKKFEIEYGGKSRLTALSGSSDPSGLHSSEENQYFLLDIRTRLKKF